MTRALLTAASGMKAQQMKVDTIANNIANANTAGFKKTGLSFRSLLYQTMREPGSPTGAGRVNPSGLQVGSGAEVADSFKVHNQGILEPTEAPFDLALEGPGFFEVTLPNGESRYTRDGSFRRDGDGTIVSPEGYPLVGAPTIPDDALPSRHLARRHRLVDHDPRRRPARQRTTAVDPLREPRGGSKRKAATCSGETVSSGTAQTQQPGQNGTAMLRQGYRERSNVQVVDELVELIVAQRKLRSELASHPRLRRDAPTTEPAHPVIDDDPRSPHPCHRVSRRSHRDAAGERRSARHRDHPRRSRHDRSYRRSARTAFHRLRPRLRTRTRLQPLLRDRAPATETRAPLPRRSRSTDGQERMSHRAADGNRLRSPQFATSRRASSRN